MAEPKPRGINPDHFKPAQQPQDENAVMFEGFTPPLRRVAEEFESMMQRNIDFTSLTVTITTPDGMSGTLQFARENENGITLTVTGELGEKLPANNGTPYGSQFDGTFFYGPSPTRPYAKTGDEVKKGQNIGWGMKNKNEQGPIASPQDGTLTYAAENGEKVAEGQTIFYIK